MDSWKAECYMIELLPYYCTCWNRIRIRIQTFEKLYRKKVNLVPELLSKDGALEKRD